MLSTSNVGIKESLCKFQEPPMLCRYKPGGCWVIRSKCYCFVMIILLLSFIKNGYKPIYGLKGLRSCLPLLSLHWRLLV